MSLVTVAVKREVGDPSPIVEILPLLSPQVQPTHMVQKYYQDRSVSLAGNRVVSRRCKQFLSLHLTPRRGLLPSADASVGHNMRQHIMAKNTAKKTAQGLKLGSLVKDSITGFTGIAIARTEFAYGCVHIRIQATGMTEAGDPVGAHSFDDQRIELLAPPLQEWPEPKKSKIKLGDVVRDLLTGAVGIVTSQTVGIDGVTRLIVEQSGLTKNGDPRPPFYANIECLKIVDRRELTVSETSEATSGGPMCRQIDELE